MRKNHIEIIYYNHPLKILSLFVGLLFFGFSGWWLIVEKGERNFDFITGGIGILFALIGVVSFVPLLFNKKPQIIIDEEGIWIKKLKQDKIKWEQISYTFSHWDNYGSLSSISIIPNESFTFKKKRNWLSFFRKKSNRHSLQMTDVILNFDADSLTKSLNTLKDSPIENRKNILLNFQVEKKKYSKKYVQNFWMNILVIIFLFALYCYSHIFLIIAAVIAFIGVFIIRWFFNYEKNSIFFKHLHRVLMTTITSLFLYVFFMITSDNIVKRVYKQSRSFIENCQQIHGSYLGSIDEVQQNINYTFVETLFVKKIEYLPTKYFYKINITNQVNHKKSCKVSKRNN